MNIKWTNKWNRTFSQQAKLIYFILIANKRWVDIFSFNSKENNVQKAILFLFKERWIFYSRTVAKTVYIYRYY